LPTACTNDAHLPHGGFVARKERQVVEHEVAQPNPERGPLPERPEGLLNVGYRPVPKFLHLRLDAHLRIRQDQKGMLVVVLG
jgi:hypothetical protein